MLLNYFCHHHREGTNIEVCVEIETHPRGARQSSLSSVLSSRSLSVRSLGHSQAQSYDFLRASELEDLRVRGEEGDRGEEGEGGEEGEVGRKAGEDAVDGEGTDWPVFEIDGI